MTFDIEHDRIFKRDEAGNIIAEVTFHEAAQKVFVIDHTFVDDSLRGQGLASKLVQAAVNEIHNRGGQVKATCSYAAEWLKRHEMQ